MTTKKKRTFAGVFDLGGRKGLSRKGPGKRVIDAGWRWGLKKAGKKKKR